MQRMTAVLLTACLIAFAGCATISQPGHGDPVTLQKDKTLVFGRLVFVENGEPAIPYSGIFGRKPQMRLFNADSGGFLTWWSGPDFDDDGSFYWVVPRGTYVIYDLRYGYRILPQVVFQTPPDADAAYLGTLTIDCKSERIVLAHVLKKLNSITVTDEFDQARIALAARNPAFKGKVETAL